MGLVDLGDVPAIRVERVLGMPIRSAMAVIGWRVAARAISMSVGMVPDRCSGAGGGRLA